ncbi:MAG TPA: redoxin domain-containing protein [Solirubrobacteraceae bacterium]|nr:redoxin domain-containing protein [Solirubrobacteraceae bacterium]
MNRRMGLGAVVLLALIVALSATPRVALGDGDPGSDVLVNQSLFVAGDAGVSVAQQQQLQSLLTTAAGAGLPVRVAIIAQPSDLGAVTELWRAPRAYAKFLGTELSLTYTNRLLVVMPDGFGLFWLHHSAASGYRALAGIAIRPGPSALIAATESAVRSLARSAGVTLGGAGQRSAAAPAGSGAAAAGSSGSTLEVPSSSAAASNGGPSGRSTDALVAVIAGVVILALAAFFVVRALRRRRRAAAAAPTTGRSRGFLGGRAIPGFATLGVLAMVAIVVALSSLGGSANSQLTAIDTNPYLDPGTPLTTMAPTFALDDQFGRAVSLRSYRGKVVLLAFTDSECTTICPMTTAAMLDARAMLGGAASKVALVGVDANPGSTSLEDVWSYSQLHGLQRQWRFLTGSLAQLRRVWKDYSIYADIQRGLISHTPALFVIAPDGREAKVYITQQSYAAVSQFGQVLAREISSLLPGHPGVHSDLSYKPVPAITPAQTVSLPSPSGGAVSLGPGRPRLFAFFATWDQEVTSLGGHLDQLNAYQAGATAHGLPRVTAVDEGVVEPSRVALAQFLRTLPRPLSYPVAVDTSGQVADGYEVLGEPWLVLTSAAGKILWYRQISTSGWPSNLQLTSDVKAALSRAPSAPATPAALTQDLAGSPAPLAALHSQSGQLLGSAPALAARIRSLRGYPIVLNAWATWCPDCVAEFKMFAAASAAYGRRVAFLGADTDDSPGDARSFLAANSVGYPSYQTTDSELSPWAVIEGLPTTIFINAAGKVMHVQSGEYFAQGALNGDIQTYALGHSG